MSPAACTIQPLKCLWTCSFWHVPSQRLLPREDQQRPASGLYHTHSEPQLLAPPSGAHPSACLTKHWCSAFELQCSIMLSGLACTCARLLDPWPGSSTGLQTPPAHLRWLTRHPPLLQVFVLIVYFMGGLKYSAGAFFSNWASVLLAVLTAQSIGLLIGSVVTVSSAASLHSLPRSLSMSRTSPQHCVAHKGHSHLHVASASAPQSCAAPQEARVCQAP